MIIFQNMFFKRIHTRFKIDQLVTVLLIGSFGLLSKCAYGKNEFGFGPGFGILLVKFS